MRSRDSASRRKRTAGFAFAVSGMVTYGLLPVFAHRFVRDMDPLLCGGVATLIGGLPLAGLLRARGTHGDLIGRRFFKPLLGIGLLGVCSTFCFFLGTKLTSGVNTGLLLQLEPFYSVLVSAVFLGETIGLAPALSTLVMAAGAAVIVFNKAEGLNSGDLLILVTPLFQQLSHVVTKKIIGKVADTTVIPAARLLYSGAIMTVVALIAQPSSAAQLASPRTWAVLIAFGLFFRALDCYLWYQAIERISLSRASATIPLSVAVSFAGSVLILHEPVRARHFLGLALILTGVVWLSAIHLREPEAAPSDEPF